MTVFLIWLTGHRTWFIGFFALGLWIGAYYSYFRQYLQGMFDRGKPHAWTVDMATKTSRRGHKRVD